jgi:hypothetical protein
MAVYTDQLSNTVIQYAMCRLSQTPQKNKHGEGSNVVIYVQSSYKVILKKLQRCTEMDKKLIEQRCSPKFGSLVSDIIYGIFLKWHTSDIAAYKYTVPNMDRSTDQYLLISRLC